jgi:hypothetical protein
MKKWKALRVIGYILGTGFGLDLAYIIYGTASRRHSPSEIVWHLIWATAMVALGIWLINKSGKKLGEKKS